VSVETRCDFCNELIYPSSEAINGKPIVKLWRVHVQIERQLEGPILEKDCCVDCRDIVVRILRRNSEELKRMLEVISRR
jgi:hypothetical protein